MRRPFLKYTASMALACAAAATPLFAQVNTGIGADPTTHVDPNWVTSWIQNTPGASWQYGPAYVVQSPPSPPWSNTAPGSFWISNNTTASLPGGTGDNTERYSYGYLQSFTSDASQIQMTIWTDNYFNWGTIDGNVFGYALGGVPSPLNADSRVFTLTLDPNVTEHRLTLQTTGDGQTDGINVQFSSVPEPSSMALLGTGLIGLIPMVRRRRKS